MSELLATLKITKQSLSRVLQELMAEDYVVQHPGQTDRRQRRLRLTSKGEALEQALTEGQRRRLARAYAQAGADAVDAFHKVLLHVIDDGDRPRLPESETRLSPVPETEARLPPLSENEARLPPLPETEVRLPPLRGRGMTIAAATAEPGIAPPLAERPHLLVVDDDLRLRALLARYLGEQGHIVSTAASAAEARALMGPLAFDLLVLDVMMPGQNGLEFAESLRREQFTVPILMLTARSEAEQRIAGLEAGADDYLPKPFEPRELLLRIAAILRRSARPPEGPRPVRLGRWRFDPDRSELVSGGEIVRLTDVETSLLRVLAQDPRRDRQPRGSGGAQPGSDECAEHRRSGQPPAPQDRGRPQDAALSPDRPGGRICPPSRLTSVRSRRRATGSAPGSSASCPTRSRAARSSSSWCRSSSRS